MTLLQTMIMPIPVPYNSGPSGPFTHSDAIGIIALTLALFTLWIIFILINWLYLRKKGIEKKFIKMFIPFDFSYGSINNWAITDFLSGLFYIILILEIIAGMGFLFYNLFI